MTAKYGTSTLAQQSSACQIRAELAASGGPIGPFDGMIAGHARAFPRVSGAGLHEFDDVMRLVLSAFDGKTCGHGV